MLFHGLRYIKGWRRTCDVNHVIFGEKKKNFVVTHQYTVHASQDEMLQEKNVCLYSYPK